MLKHFSSYWSYNHFLCSFFCLCKVLMSFLPVQTSPEYALLIVTYLFNRFVMNEFPQEIVDFDNKAKKIFFSLYENFAQSAKQLDRKKDENVFQQQQSKYLNTLKTQLENLAQESLNKNISLKNINLLNKKLRDEINAYLNEFMQKSRSL